MITETSKRPCSLSKSTVVPPGERIESILALRAQRLEIRRARHDMTFV